MATYDINGALAAGVSPTDILDVMQNTPGLAPSGYDLAGARKAGVPDADIARTIALGTHQNKVGTFDVYGARNAGSSPTEIADELARTPDSSPMDIAGARSAGYSDQEIIDYLTPSRARTSMQGVPVFAPILRGVAHAQASVANLAQDLGFPETANDLRSRIPQADLNAPTTAADLSAQIAAGHYGAAASDIPGAVLEQFIPIATGLAGGALTGGAGLAATVGRLAGGAVVGGVTQGDDIARARAANNGRAAPDASDLALGLAGGAATGTVGSVGLGGAGKGLAGAATAALSHGVADAAQPELSALAGSVGTATGAQNAFPSDVAAAALTGLATRAGMSAGLRPVETLHGMTPAGRSAAARDAWAALTPEQQQQATEHAALAQAIQTVKDSAVGTAQPSDRVAAATAAADMAAQVSRYTDQLDQQGVLSVNLFPMNEAAQSVGIPHIEFRRGLPHGPVKVTMPDGEVLTGSFQVAIGGGMVTAFGSGGAATVVGMNAGGNFYAAASGPRTTIVCRGDVTFGHGGGECQTQQGALYQVQM